MSLIPEDIRRTGHRLTLFLGATARVLQSRLKSYRPFFISHLITTRCFARCPTCLWRGNAPEERDTNTIVDFYGRARRAGFVSTTFWGGEPLIRADIGDVLHACRDLGFVTGLITNGYLLPKHHRLLAETLDFLIVSLDFPSPAHDQFRGVPGLFERALEGIGLIREANSDLKVFLNTVVSRFNRREAEGVITLAESLGLTVTFESVNEGPPEFPREDNQEIHDRLRLSEEREIFRRLRQQRDNGAPVNNSRTYLRLFEKGRVRYRCHAPKICLRVEPDGTVTNCLDREHPLGNAYKDDLEALLESPRLRRLQRAAESCTRCVDTGVIESSLFWDFHPEVVMNTLRLFLR